MKFWYSFALCLVIATPGFAQPTPNVSNAPTTFLSGNLSPAPVANRSDIAIVLTDLSTNVSQRLYIAGDGSFSAAIPPGTYRVEVERLGRRQTVGQNLVIASGATGQNTIQIDLAPAAETVEIEAQAPGSEDDPPDVGRSYETRFVRSLPVVDRNYQELNGLMSGITPPSVNFSRTIDPQRSRSFNTNGLPSFTNDNQLDGTSIREPVTGVLSVRVLPDEAVKQLNLRTSNYSADRGFAAGSISNVLTRPGTNGLHGSLFGFFTDEYLQARNALVPANVGQPGLHHWQYGATAGGALIPNTMFAFLSYEGTRDNSSALQFATVPTSAMLAGNFSGLGVTVFNPATGTAAGTGRTAFTGGLIPTASINPTSRAVARFFPVANQPGLANNYAAEVPYSIHSNVGDAKLDYRFSDALTGFLRYGITHINSTQDSLFGPVIGSPETAGLRNHHASLSLVGNYHGIIGELQFGYSRYRNGITSSALPGILPASLTGAGGTLPPPISITGLGALGTEPGIPGRDVDNLYEGTANFHINRGAHQVTFGVNIRSNLADGFEHMQLGLYGPTGGFLFGPGATSLAGAAPGGPNAVFANSIASFLLGAPSTRGIVNPIVVPSYRQTQYAAYVSDTWHATPRLAVDVGLRWEVYSPVETRGPLGAMAFTPGATAAATNLAFGSSLNNGDYDWKNLSPRFGVTYRVTEHTVVRTAYSLNYFPFPFLYSGLNAAETGTVQGVAGSFGSTSFAVPAVPTTTTGVPNIPYVVRTQFKTPYTQNYYFMIQQGLPLGFVFDIGYIGNVGRQLPILNQINAARPGTGVVGLPFGSVGVTAPVTGIAQENNSRYDSLQVNLSKRLSKGASLAAAYTYGKAIDQGLVQINPFNRAANRGPADWDRQHNLTLSHLLALPVGIGSPRFNRGIVGQILANWELVGIFRWATGTPYSVFADPLACACPGNNSILANPGAGADSIAGSAFFNPALFSAPPAGTIGIQGRNSFRGPDLTSYNVSLFKSFAVRENWKLELRGEAYNILNSVQFDNPANNVSFATFGQSSSTVNGVGGRLFVVGARVLF